MLLSNPHSFRIAVITYSLRPRVLVDFNGAANASELITLIRSAEYLESATRTGAALSAAADLLTASDSGRRVGVPAAVLLVTDGETSEDAATFDASLANLQSTNASIYAAGVGMSVTYATLALVASDESTVMHVADTATLATDLIVMQAVEVTVCSTLAQASTSTANATTSSPSSSSAPPLQLIAAPLAACAVNIELDVILLLDSSARLEMSTCICCRCWEGTEAVCRNDARRSLSYSDCLSSSCHLLSFCNPTALVILAGAT